MTMKKETKKEMRMMKGQISFENVMKGLKNTQEMICH